MKASTEVAARFAEALLRKDGLRVLDMHGEGDDVLRDCAHAARALLEACGEHDGAGDPGISLHGADPREFHATEFLCEERGCSLGRAVATKTCPWLVTRLSDNGCFEFAYLAQIREWLRGDLEGQTEGPGGPFPRGLRPDLAVVDEYPPDTPEAVDGVPTDAAGAPAHLLAQAEVKATAAMARERGYSLEPSSIRDGHWQIVPLLKGDGRSTFDAKTLADIRDYLSEEPEVLRAVADGSVTRVPPGAGRGGVR